jgi:hypothetical protein
LRLPGASALHPWTTFVAGVEPEAFPGGVRVPLKPGSEGEIVRSGWDAFGVASPACADQVVVMAYFSADSFELAQLILDVAPAMAEELSREAEKEEAPGSDDPEPLLVEGLSSWWENDEVRFSLGDERDREPLVKPQCPGHDAAEKRSETSADPRRRRMYPRAHGGGTTLARLSR